MNEDIHNKEVKCDICERTSIFDSNSKHWCIENGWDHVVFLDGVFLHGLCNTCSKRLIVNENE